MWTQYVNKIVEPKCNPFSGGIAGKKMTTSAAGSGCSGCENCSGDGDGCGPGMKLFATSYAASSCEGCGHCSDGTCGSGPGPCSMDD